VRIDIWNADNKTFIRFEIFNMDEYDSFLGDYLPCIGLLAAGVY
jgi:hypothetical protein